MVGCLLSLSCDQNMTINDYEQHGLECYESKKKKIYDDVAKKINVQTESGVKKCDSSVASEICGPLGWHWD